MMPSYDELWEEVCVLKSTLRLVWGETGQGQRPTDMDCYLPPDLVARIGAALGLASPKENTDGVEVALNARGHLVESRGENFVTHGADAAVGEDEAAVSGDVVGADVLEGLVADGAIGVQVFVPAEAKTQGMARAQIKGDRP